MFTLLLLLLLCLWWCGAAAAAAGVRYFFRQMVEGLSYCHNCHIAHRDLKLAQLPAVV